MLLGLDIGTSSAKALIIDEAGAVRGEGTADYPVDQPRQGWSEQPPRRWWEGAARAIRHATANAKLAGADIRAVGLSGQMHGSVLLGADAIRAAATGPIDALRPALLWNDQRTAAQCQEIEQAVGGRRRLVELVGNAALTGFTLPKLLWVREHEPSTFARVAAIALPKDFVRLQLTGRLATDVGDASGTLLFDVERRAWSGPAAAAVGLDPAILPPVLESAALAGEITPWAAAQTGLRAGTPVAAGSGDNQAGAIGAGAVTPGTVLAMLGTSGVVYAHAERPRKDLDPAAPGRVHTMCAADGSARAPGDWSVTGCMLSAAGSLQWARDTVAPGVAFEALMAEAAAAPPGCEGLVFLPYLTGERCPYPDPAARGAWIGLTSRHTRAHLVRAVLEGVAFGMNQMLRIVRGLPVPVDTVRLSGGGNRSELWRRIQADVYRVPVVTTNTEHGSAYGAALLAGVGAGTWRSVREACAATIREAERREPGPDAPAYERAREAYESLYPTLAPTFAALASA